MTEERDLPDSKLTRSKQRWASEGKFLTGQHAQRTAQRLLVDLKARLDVPDLDLTGAEVSPAGARQTVRDALTGLGYSAEEVRDVLTRLPERDGVEELLRDALRALASGR